MNRFFPAGTALWLAALLVALPVAMVSAQDTVQPGERPDETEEGEVIREEHPAMEPGASPVVKEKTVTVMGVEIHAKSGAYVVTADANVRSGPGTTFARVDGVRQGDRVDSIGYPEGKDWVAIAVEGKTMGFVYAGVLLPVVDGALGDEIRGVLMQGDNSCEYRLRFEGKSEVEDDNFETSDYEIRFRCASDEGSIIFYSHMFLTEAAVSRGRHQIAIDVRSIGDGMEKYLTTNFLYDPASGKLVYDGQSMPDMAAQPEKTEATVTAIPGALVAALEMAVSGWGPKAWERLYQRAR